MLSQAPFAAGLVEVPEQHALRQLLKVQKRPRQLKSSTMNLMRSWEMLMLMPQPQLGHQFLSQVPPLSKTWIWFKVILSTLVYVSNISFLEFYIHSRFQLSDI